MTLTAASPSSSLSLQTGGRLFKRLEDQPEIEDAVLDIFMEEVLESVRGRCRPGRCGHYA